MTEPLKSCPFCGSDDIYYVSCYPWGAFSCNSCECNGPRVTIREDDNIRMNEARKAWDERK